MEQNARHYQAELLKLQPFLISCFEKQVGLLQEFWDSLEESRKTVVRIKGLKQARLSLFQMYWAFLVTINNPTMDFHYRESILKSLRDSTPVLISILSLNHRVKIISLIEQNWTSIPDIAFSD